MTATSVIWWPTNQAATRMGLTKHHLMAMMEKGVFTENVHYRRAGMGSGFAWDIEATRLAIRAMKG